MLLSCGAELNVPILCVGEADLALHLREVRGGCWADSWVVPRVWSFAGFVSWWPHIVPALWMGRGCWKYCSGQDAGDEDQSNQQPLLQTVSSCKFWLLRKKSNDPPSSQALLLVLCSLQLILTPNLSRGESQGSAGVLLLWGQDSSV